MNLFSKKKTYQYFNSHVFWRFVDEIAVGKPDPPETPALAIEVPQDLQGSTYFACKFQASQQANLVHVVRWLIDDEELPMSKQVLSGTSSRATLNPAKLSGSLLNKKVFTGCS